MENNSLLAWEESVLKYISSAQLGAFREKSEKAEAEVKLDPSCVFLKKTNRKW